MPRVVHFEICAKNPERASKFYKAVFGWKITKWAGPQSYWLISTGRKGTPGIDGGILKRSHKDDRTVNTVDVRSIEQAMKTIKKAGGKILMPVMTIPGIGYMTYCEDTEGVCFGIMQADKKAKPESK